MKTIQQKGFYIKDAYKKEIFRNAFQIHEYGPADLLSEDDRSLEIQKKKGQTSGVRKTARKEELPF